MAFAVSVLLPADRDVAVTLRALEAIARLPEDPAFEVVLVVDADDAETRALSAGLAGDVQVLIADPWTGFGDACDLAARSAGAERLALLSAAAVPTDGWLDDVLGALDGDDVRAALPRSLGPGGAELPDAAWLALAVTTEAYMSVGGFAGTREAGRSEKATLVEALAPVARARAAVLLGDGLA